MAHESVANEKPLPARAARGYFALNRAIACRRTRREFGNGPLSLQHIAELLWAGQGMTGEGRSRTAPSAGAQYPLALYLAVGSVEEMLAGVYRYAAERHALRRESPQDARPRLGAAALGEQPWVEQAAAVLVIAADLAGMARHFHAQPPEGQRGARYAHMEAGAVAQNIHLTATALDLGLVLVAGFDDEQVAQAMGFGDDLSPLAMLCIGLPPQ